MDPPSRHSSPSMCPTAVLVVEDHASYRDVVVSALEAFFLGLVVVSAESIETAVVALRNQQFTAVITDMTLPDGSAIDLVTRTRRDLGKPPVFLVFSNHPLSELMPQLAANEVHFFVAKEEGLVALANMLVVACPMLAILK